jgi:hypothetical protein
MGMGAAAVGLIPWGKLIGKAIGKFRGAGGAIPELGGDIGPARQIFAGSSSKTAEQGLRKSAELMADQGASPAQIRKATGWHMLPSGEWSYEIPDFSAKLKSFSGKGKLPDILEHPEAYEAYPHLKNIRVERTKLPKGEHGHYDPIEGGVIRYSEDISPEEARKTILHEIQHDIQREEAFPFGSNVEEEISKLPSDIRGKIMRHPEVATYREQALNLEKSAMQTDDPVLRQKLQAQADAMFEAASVNMKKFQRYEAYEKYRRQAGEAQARDVAYRSKMTPEELAAKEPFQSVAEREGIYPTEFNYRYFD